MTTHEGATLATLADTIRARAWRAYPAPCDAPREHDDATLRRAWARYRAARDPLARAIAWRAWHRLASEHEGRFIGPDLPTHYGEDDE